MEQSVGLITAANSSVQDTSKVGNALKSISLRLRGISEDGSNVSDLIPTLEKKFNSMGMSLKKDENTFKSTYEIFSDIHKVYGSLNGLQKSDLLELVAGKENANVAASLIQNWKDAEGALQSGLESFGSAAKENSRYIESVAGHISKFQNAANSFWSSNITSNALKDIVDIGTSLIGVLSKLTNTFGGLNLVIFTTTASILKFSSAGKSLVGTVSSMIPLSNELGRRVERLSVAVERASTSNKMLGVSLTGLKVALIGARVASAALEATMTMGLSLAITAIVSGLTALYSAHQKNKEMQQQVKAQNEQIANTWSTQKDKIQELVATYNELSKSTHNGSFFANSTEEEKYKNTIQEISQLLPNLVESINSKGEAHLKSASAIEQEIAYTERLAALNDKQKVLDSSSNFKDQLSNLGDLQSQITSLQKKIDNGGRYEGGGRFARFVKFDESEINQFKMQLLGIQQELANTSNIVRTDVESIVRTILTINNVKISDNFSQEIAKLTSNINVDSLKPEELTAKANAIAGFFTNLDKLKKASSISEATQLGNQVTTLGQSIGLTDAQIQELVKSLNDMSGAQVQATDSTFNFATESSKLAESFKTAKDEIAPLNQALADLADGQSLSSETVAQLILQYPELAGHISKTTDGWVIEKGAIESVRNAQVQLKVDALKAQLSMSNAAYNALSARLTMYDIEIDKINNLKDAMDAVAKINTPNIAGASPALRNMGNTVTDKIEKEVMDLGKARDQLNSLGKLLNDPGFGTSGDGKPEKKQKEKALTDQATFRDLTDEHIAKINQEADAQDKLNKKLEEKAKNLSSEKKYQEAIKATTALITGEESEIAKLKTANTNLGKEMSNLQKNHPKFNMSKWLDSDGNATEFFGSFINGLKSKKGQDEAQKLFDEYQKLFQARQKNNEAIDQNTKNIAGNQKEVDALRLENTSVWLDKLTKKYAELDSQLDTSKTVQSMYAEGTKEYNAETQNQINILEEKRKLVEGDIGNIEGIIAGNDKLVGSEKRTSDQIKLLTEDLKERKKTLLELKKEEFDTTVLVARNILKARNDIDQATADSYQERIDNLQKSWDMEAESEERSKRQLELSKLQQQLSVLQSGNLANISDEMAKQLGLEQEKADAVQRQNDLIKQQQVLQSVQNEKNVRLFQDGEFKWVADPRKVREEQDRLTQMQEDFAKWKQDNISNTQDDLKKQTEDYNRWELDTTRKHLIDDLQEKINAKNKEIEERNKWFENNITAIGNHNIDINAKVSEGLDTVNGTMGSKWDGILSTLKGKLDAAKQMYAEMLSMSQAAAAAGASQDPNEKGSGASSSGGASTSGGSKTSSKSNQQVYLENLQKSGTKGQKTWASEQLKMKKYHTGVQQGIVGESGSISSWLSSKFPALQNKEVFARLLNGEMVIKDPANMVQNFLTGTNGLRSTLDGMKQPNVSSDNSVTENYTINVDKVVTNDASQFLTNLKMKANFKR